MVNILVSDELKEILEGIKTESVVAALLLKGEHNPEDLVDNHVNYISIGSHDRTKISYLTPERISTLSEGEFWRTGRRYQGKPGAFVSKLFKNIDSREVEKFATLLKTQANAPSFRFEVVKGEEIRKWYKFETNESNRGTLGASCMKHEFCQPFLNIYTENSCVSMLIMLNNDDILLGRALLWDFDSNKIMDRIYTVSDEEYQFHFKQWATKNDYFYKSEQNWYNTLFFEKVGTPKQEIKLEVSLSSFNFNKYPYMDTFKFINLNNGKLFNYIPDDMSYVKTLCASDGGRFEPDYLKFDDIDRVLRHRGDCVYLDYLQCYTSSSNAVWSDINDQYILNRDAFYDEEIRDYLFNSENDEKNKKEKIEKRREYIKAEIQRENERREKLKSAKKTHPAFRDTIERYIQSGLGIDIHGYVNEILSDVSEPVPMEDVVPDTESEPMSEPIREESNETVTRDGEVRPLYGWYLDSYNYQPYTRTRRSNQIVEEVPHPTQEVEPPTQVDTQISL